MLLLVLLEAVKDIQKLKVDLTIEEKKCLEMVNENLFNETVKILKPLEDMGMRSEETIIIDDNQKMIKEYLEDTFIVCHKICKEIQKLGICPL